MGADRLLVPADEGFIGSFAILAAILE